MSPVQRLGGRKFALGLVYMAGCFGICIAAVVKGQAGWDAVGIAALPTSIATGLAAVIWGNVQEHRSNNGQS